MTTHELLTRIEERQEVYRELDATYRRLAERAAAAVAELRQAEEALAAVTQELAALYVQLFQSDRSLAPRTLTDDAPPRP